MSKAEQIAEYIRQHGLRPLIVGASVKFSCHDGIAHSVVRWADVKRILGY